MFQGIYYTSFDKQLRLGTLVNLSVVISCNSCAICLFWHLFVYSDVPFGRLLHDSLVRLVVRHVAPFNDVLIFVSQYFTILRKYDVTWRIRDVLKRSFRSKCRVTFYRDRKWMYCVVPIKPRVQRCFCLMKMENAVLHSAFPPVVQILYQCCDRSLFWKWLWAAVHFFAYDLLHSVVQSWVFCFPHAC